MLQPTEQIELVGSYLGIDVSDQDVDWILHHIQNMQSGSVYTHVKTNESIKFASVPHDPPYVLKPKFVVVATGLRTGSTVLYNIARLWLLLGDPNTLAYFHLHDFVDPKAWLQKNQSFLNKVHATNNFTIKPDVLLFSHRKPSDQLCSIKCFGLGIPNCTVQKRMQEKFYRWKESLNPPAFYDLPFENLVSNPLAEIRKVGKLIGIYPLKETDDMLKRMHGNKFFTVGHPLTLIHASHISNKTKKKKICATARTQVEVECPLWEQNQGAFVI